MSILVLLLALSMPAVSWMSQAGYFGADIATVSHQYPTLIVAAGYAFSIWGLIFALSLGFGVYQVLPMQRGNVLLRRVRPLAAIVFALTSAWMIFFPIRLFGLALAVIVASAALLIAILWRLPASGQDIASADRFWVRATFTIFAAWVGLATFLDIAQTLVAYGFDGVRPVVWSVALLAVAGALLLVVNQRLRGSAPYVSVALWALTAIYIEQSDSLRSGASVTAWTALMVAFVLAAQFLWLRLVRAREIPQPRLSPRVDFVRHRPPGGMHRMRAAL